MPVQPAAKVRETRGVQSYYIRLFAEVDSASAIFFRVAFGALMAKWAWDYLEIGRVRTLYIEPVFHFTYYGFDWIQPWPGEGMIWHFVGLLILAIGIAVGCFYKVSCLLFALGFTYVFLLDRTNYQNHYYLIALIAWWLPWLPLNRNVSVDACWWPAIRSQTIPAWTLWVLRFHVALPYFFGGVAKLTPDWLLGEPLGQMLTSQRDLPILGSLLATEGTSLILAWSAVLFDLLAVPMLLWRRTRGIAFAMCIVFHLMNSIVFNIHVFPWFMLLATPIFFEPDWLRGVLGGSRLSSDATPSDVGRFSRRQRSLAIAGFGLYVAFQCAWPLRHHVYPGDASWNERGHYFAWRMMLRGKTVVLSYAIKDKVTGEVADGQVNRFINADQSEKLGRDPEMVLHFAHFLGEQYRKATGHEPAVHVLALASLNGRKPVLMVDPNIDLMAERRGFYEREWLLPQTEPLRHPHWDVPPAQWRQYVEIPKLNFMSTVSRSEQAREESKALAASG